MGNSSLRLSKVLLSESKTICVQTGMLPVNIQIVTVSLIIWLQCLLIKTFSDVTFNFSSDCGTFINRSYLSIHSWRYDPARIGGLQPGIFPPWRTTSSSCRLRAMVDITNDVIMILVIIIWLTLVIILSLCQKTQPNYEYNASEYLGYVARTLLLCFFVVLLCEC